MGTRRVAGFGAVLTTLLLLLYVGSIGALAAPAPASAGTLAMPAIPKWGGSEGGAGVCSPSPTGKPTVIPATPTTPETITCTISQPTPAPWGHLAFCIEHSSSPAVVETCNITQFTLTGANAAVVIQTAGQRGAVLTATQRATVTQTNTSGWNLAGVAQSVSQSTQGDVLDQNQTSDQGFRHFSPFQPGVVITQHNGTGGNLIGLDQSASQQQATESPTVLQDQKAGQDAKLDQLHSPTDAGPTRSFIKQHETQDQDGPVAGNQTRLADPHCCNTFNGNSVRVDLSQDIVQMGQAGAMQDAANEAHCHVIPNTKGTCNVRQTINQNGAVVTTTCSAAACDTAQQCDNGVCVQVACDTFTGEGTPSCFFGPPFGGGYAPVAVLSGRSAPSWASSSGSLQARGRPILA
jgi:hypothetical protein